MKEARKGPVIKGLGYQGNTGIGQMLARFPSVLVQLAEKRSSTKEQWHAY